MHLVDRAERHALLPAEARALRAGVEQLRERAEAPVQSRGEVRAVLLSWVEAVAPGVSVREVDGLVRALSAVSESVAAGLARSCPQCRVEPGVWCRPLRGGRRPWRLHVGRRRLAGELR